MTFPAATRAHRTLALLIALVTTVVLGAIAFCVGVFLFASSTWIPLTIALGAFVGASNVTYNTKLKKWILMASAQVPLTEPSVKYPRGKYAAENAKRSIEYTGLRGIRTARSSGDFFRTGRAGGPYRRQLRGKLGGFPGRLAPVAPGWGTY